MAVDLAPGPRRFESLKKTSSAMLEPDSFPASYRLCIAVCLRLHLALVQRFSQVFNIHPLFIFRHRSQPTMEAAVLKNTTSEVVGRGYHPDVSRKEWVREDLEDACQVLARPSSNAYSVGEYLARGLVELGKPVGDVFSQRLVTGIRPVQEAWVGYVSVGESNGGSVFDLGRGQ